MDAFGIHLHRDGYKNRFTIAGNQTYRAGDHVVEPDAMQAIFGPRRPHWTRESRGPDHCMATGRCWWRCWNAWGARWPMTRATYASPRSRFGASTWILAICRMWCPPLLWWPLHPRRHHHRQCRPPAGQRVRSTGGLEQRTGQNGIKTRAAAECTPAPAAGPGATIETYDDHRMAVVCRCRAQGARRDDQGPWMRGQIVSDVLGALSSCIKEWFCILTILELAVL